MTLTYKLVIVGAGGVGKSTLVHRRRTGRYMKRNIATIGVEVHPIRFFTNYGEIVLNTWDVAGQDKYAGAARVQEMRQSCYQRAHACIGMYDVTNARRSYHELQKHLKLVHDTIGDIPTCIVANKVDLAGTHKCSVMNKDHVKYSVRSNCNFEQPFLQLLRELTGHPDLLIGDY